MDTTRTLKLFRMTEQQSVKEITGTSMRLERDLQDLFQKNLRSLMEIDFLASEYSTTDGLRIDMLGLDENNSPVIIEYKRGSNANIVTQGLSYLDWLMDHRADFRLLVQKKMGHEKAAEIDWSTPRLILLATGFSRHDVRAINQINRNIELIRYRKFEDKLLMLDLSTATTDKSPTTTGQERGSILRKEHEKIIDEARGEQKTRYDELREFLFSLGDDAQERHLKNYVAFRRIKNFACVQLVNQKGHILVLVKGDINDIDPTHDFIQDIGKIGRFGTGNIKITISSEDHLERAKDYIRRSYESA